MITSTSSPSYDSKSISPPLTLSLRRIGFSFVNKPKDADFYIGFNHDQNSYRDFIKFGGSKNRAALIRLEPRAVFHSQYGERVESLYGQIYTLGATNASNHPHIPWPYYYNQNPLQPDAWIEGLEKEIKDLIEGNCYDLDSWKNRLHTLTLIATNKVSAVGKNNYQLRREMAQKLPKSVLSVFGTLWESSLLKRLSHRLNVLVFAIRTHSRINLVQLYGNLFRKYPNCLGSVNDKHSVIRNSRFSLVIENDNYYVSEKLIDAILGGSIPIYFGGEFLKLGIPESIVVSGLDSANDVLTYINNVPDCEVEKRLSAAYDWLRSDDFLPKWFGDTVFDSLGTKIGINFRKLVG